MFFQTVLWTVKVKHTPYEGFNKLLGYTNTSSEHSD